MAIICFMEMLLYGLTEEELLMGKLNLTSLLNITFVLFCPYLIKVY